MTPRPSQTTNQFVLAPSLAYDFRQREDSALALLKQKPLTTNQSSPLRLNFHTDHGWRGVKRYIRGLLMSSKSENSVENHTKTMSVRRTEDFI